MEHTSTLLRGTWQNAVHRLPAPQTEPPYDDEPPPRAVRTVELPVTALQGTLALAFPLPTGDPEAAVRAPLRLVRELATEELDRLPDPRAWARQLARALVEVLGGHRPVSQLVRWTTEEVLTELTVHVSASWGSPAERRRSGARIRSVHVAEPLRGIAEVTVLADVADRIRAAAMRLEGVSGRWLCTAVELRL